MNKIVGSKASSICKLVIIYLIINNKTLYKMLFYFCNRESRFLRAQYLEGNTYEEVNSEFFQRGSLGGLCKLTIKINS